MIFFLVLVDLDGMGLVWFRLGWIWSDLFFSLSSVSSVVVVFVVLFGVIRLGKRNVRGEGGMHSEDGGLRVYVCVFVSFSSGRRRRDWGWDGMGWDTGCVAERRGVVGSVGSSFLLALPVRQQQQQQQSTCLPYNTVGYQVCCMVIMVIGIAR